MRMRSQQLRKVFVSLGFVSFLVFNLACARTLQSSTTSFWSVSGESMPTDIAVGVQPTVPSWGLPAQRVPGDPIFTPTPDAPHPLPTIRIDPDQYRVQPGDTLGQIANLYGVSVAQLVMENELTNPNILEVGQVLIVPEPNPQGEGPDFKIIPDSELVNGPVNMLFDVDEFVNGQGGFLTSYKEAMEDESLSGAQVVDRVAREFSVNPRLLLAVLEYQSGWLTSPNPKKATLEYPIGVPDPLRKGLYRQLAWAANNLNRGYYLWRVNGVATWLLSDGSIVPVAPTINAGTAGVQQMFAMLYGRDVWETAVSSDGIFATYNDLFGYPFDYAIDPLLPSGLQQPTLQLPFEPATTWAFTGGPHGAWGDGSAWGALDFAPPGNAVGCVLSDDWVVALTNGLITRSAHGAVIQDLDGDGFEQTGWVILYMHIEARDRVQAGAFLNAGERIGHPSCEGGVSSGTHVHLARRYNGEWIAADQSIPFVLDGWVSSGAGAEYDGFLQRDGVSVEAYAGRSPENEVYR